MYGAVAPFFIACSDEN